MLDIGAVLILYTEERPQAAAGDLGETNEKGGCRRVLGVVRENGVEDPVEAEDRVECHDEVVWPAGLEGGDVAEEAVVRVWLEEGKVHEDVPERCKSQDKKKGRISYCVLQWPRSAPELSRTYQCRTH